VNEKDQAMTLTIELSSEIEQRLQAQAAAVGCDLSSFVQRLLTENLEDEVPIAGQPRRSAAEFMARLQAIMDRHPGSGGHLDDSRESIYAGCGE
jgi:predicted transcriptional regulator